jgi:6-phosphogluconolactonase (cycloisomerase 2 family)
MFSSSHAARRKFPHLLTALVASALVASCGGDSVTKTATYSVGGLVNGLVGTGLVLQDNSADNLAVSGNGPFTFSMGLTNGSSYLVSVATQPTNPSQNCIVVNASGEISAAKVTSVQVQCSTEGFTIGGSVTGLTGSGLVLQDNAGDDLPISASGPFTFLQTVGSGSGYAVTVKTQPTSPGQTCAVTNGSGTVGSANVTNVLVTCTTTINKYTVSVAVSGLQAGATGLHLLDNGGDSLSITGNATFTFATAITSGQPYAVTVGMQPTATPAQYCIVQNGSGTVTTANITNVTLTCRRVGQALFVANSQDGAGNTGSVGGYTINPATGVLTAAIGSPFTAANTDLNPNSVTLDISGQHAYVANLNSSNVSTFSVLTSAGVPTGALAFSADTATSAAPPYKTFTVAVSPNGSYAFVGSDENPKGIVDAYTLSGGVPTSVGPATTAGNDPMVMVVDPTNKFLFAPEPFDTDVAVFTIGTGGVLSPAVYFPSGPGALGPTGVTLLPPSNGQPGYIFVANTGDATQAVGATVLAFSYDGASGALATVGSPYAVGSAGFSLPMAVTIDPTERFLYVTDYNDNTVSEFAINATNGQLQPVGTPVATGTAPVDIKIEPSGHFAYVANLFGNTIDVYGIDPTTGALTLVPSGGSVPTGTGPMSIAIE